MNEVMDDDNTAAGDREQEQGQERVENENTEGTFTLQELLHSYRRILDEQRPPALGFGTRRDR